MDNKKQDSHHQQNQTHDPKKSEQGQKVSEHQNRPNDPNRKEQEKGHSEKQPTR